MSKKSFRSRAADDPSYPTLVEASRLRLLGLGAAALALAAPACAPQTTAGRLVQEEDYLPPDAGARAATPDAGQPDADTPIVTAGEPPLEDVDGGSASDASKPR